MAVPEQVRKQSEAIQKLYAESAEADPKVVGTEEAPQDDAQPNDTADSAGDPAEQPSSVEPEGGVQEDENSPTYKQRWRSLQGMYDLDFARVSDEKAQLEQRVQGMERLIAEMQEAYRQQPAAESAPASSLTDEEIEEYGESIDIMRKVSGDTVSGLHRQIADLTQLVQQLQGNVVPQVHHLTQQNAQNNEQRFWSDLSGAVPEWRTINENPDFQSWLLEVDPLTGMSRQAFLEDAQRNLDVGRVAKFFDSWGGTTKAPVTRKPSSELESQITPGRGRTTPPARGGEKRTYTPQDLSDFYDEVRRGVYVGKADERNAIERDIFAAQAEGRIVYV